MNAPDDREADVTQLPDLSIPITETYYWNWDHGGNGEHMGCCVCGKAVKRPLHLVLVDGSYCAVDPNTDPRLAELGWRPIGPDCLRKHPELRPYLRREAPR